jgi:hypothetical protein
MGCTSSRNRARCYDRRRIERVDFPAAAPGGCSGSFRVFRVFRGRWSLHLSRLSRVPTDVMTRELRQKTKIQLALAVARGRSVALWARDNQVPRSTAYRWASQPEVRAAAESRRRRARNCALGRMASRAYRASYEVAKLAECAESDTVRLRALRSIVSGAIATSKFAVLERRMSTIRKELHQRTETAGPSCSAVPCSPNGPAEASM